MGNRQDANNWIPSLAQDHEDNGAGTVLDTFLAPLPSLMFPNKNNE
jgi:hypothetical protein